MSQASLDRFVEAVRQDSALQKKLASAGSAAEMARVAVQAASERGLGFTADEFLAKLQAAPGAAAEGSELSDDQLESVAGGLSFLSGLLGGLLMPKTTTPEDEAKERKNISDLISSLPPS